MTETVLEPKFVIAMKRPEGSRAGEIELLPPVGYGEFTMSETAFEA